MIRQNTFEQPLLDLEEHIHQLKQEQLQGINNRDAIDQLEQQAHKLKQDIFTGMTPHQHVQIARHLGRPYTLDYVDTIFSGFIELHGDRHFGDDRAMVAGLAWLDGRPLAIVGQQKGRDAQERQRRNFGMAHPEGYRKAARIMKMAAKFGRPIISFVDTSGAACLEEAEARGICNAIAECQREMAVMGVPIIVVIIGEGGSGGAIGIGIGNKVLMMEFAIYSVIQPESCAAIVWRDQGQADKASDALHLTAKDTIELGVADLIIPEPTGGAHRDFDAAADSVKKAIAQALHEFAGWSPKQLQDHRYEKFRAMGAFYENGTLQAPAQLAATIRERAE